MVKITKDQIDLEVLEYLKGCKRILDVGCGKGRFMLKSPDRIEGIDIDEGNVVECKKEGLKVRVGDVLDLPYEDSSFDCVHTSHVIEHFFPKDLYRALGEMDRVLKSGGILVIRSPCAYDGFWGEIDHVRPYPARTIQGYLKNYSVLRRIYRRKPISRYGIFVKTGYCLILEKQATID